MRLIRKNILDLQIKAFFIPICCALLVLLTGNACYSKQSRHLSGNIQKAPGFQEARDEITSIDADKLEEYRQIPMQDFFTDYLKLASNEPVDLNGFMIDSPKSILEDHQDDIETLSDEFPTLGDWIDSVSDDSTEEFDPSSFEQGAEIANYLFNEGGYENLQSSENSELNQSLHLLLSTDEELLCWGAALGFVGGVGNIAIENPWGMLGVVSGIRGMASHCEGEKNVERACPLSDIRCIPVD